MTDEFSLEFNEEELEKQFKQVCIDENTESKNLAYQIVGNPSVHVLSTLIAQKIGGFVSQSFLETDLINHLGWGHLLQGSTKTSLNNKIVSNCTSAYVSVLNRKEVKGIPIVHSNAGKIQFFFCQDSKIQLELGDSLLCGPTCYFRDNFLPTYALEGISSFKVVGVGFMGDAGVRFNGKPLPKTLSCESQLLISHETFLQYILQKSRVPNTQSLHTTADLFDIMHIVDSLPPQTLGGNWKTLSCTLQMENIKKEATVLSWLQFLDMQNVKNMIVFGTGRVHVFAWYQNDS